MGRPRPGLDSTTGADESSVEYGTRASAVLSCSRTCWRETAGSGCIDAISCIERGSFHLGYEFPMIGFSHLFRPQATRLPIYLLPMPRGSPVQYTGTWKTGNWVLYGRP